MAQQRRAAILHWLWHDTVSCTHKISSYSCVSSLTVRAFLVVMAIVAITGQMLFKKHPYPNPPAQRRAPIQQEAAKQEEV